MGGVAGGRGLGVGEDNGNGRRRVRVRTISLSDMSDSGKSVWGTRLGLA